MCLQNCGTPAIEGRGVVSEVLSGGDRADQRRDCSPISRFGERRGPMQFNGSFLQAFVGSSQVIVMSVASVLLSIMVALIPFIASRVVRGDIGGTLMTVISGAMTAGAVASGLAFAGGGRFGCRSGGAVRRAAIPYVRWFRCSPSR